MKKTMLTAFRMCGEIDDDGAPDSYGSEQESNSDRGESDENYGEGHDENRDNGNGSDNDTVKSYRMRNSYFPVYKFGRDNQEKRQIADSDDDNSGGQDDATENLRITKDGAARHNDIDQDFNMVVIDSDDEANESVTAFNQ